MHNVVSATIFFQLVNTKFHVNVFKYSMDLYYIHSHTAPMSILTYMQAQQQQLC